MFHDFENAATVDLPDIFVVQQLVEGGSEPLIFLLPLDLIFEESEGIGEDLLAEGALILKMLLTHRLLMLVEVVVFDLLQVFDRLQVHFLPRLSNSVLIIEDGDVDGRLDPRLAQVVQSS